MTLLHRIYYNHVKEAKKILDGGFNINHIFESYYDPNYLLHRRNRTEKITALEYAILLNKPDMIDLLLAYNPSTFPYNNTKTALINAGKCVSVDTLKKLIKYYEDKHSPEYTLKYIVNGGVDSYCYGYVGLTPLICATTSNNFENTKFLLDYGANPYLTSGYNETCLWSCDDENIVNLINDYMINYHVKLMYSIERFNVIPNEILLLISKYMSVPVYLDDNIV